MVVSKLGSSPNPAANVAEAVVGSEATLALCKASTCEVGQPATAQQAASGKGVDPWTFRDPWAHYNKNGTGPAPSTAALKQVEDKVEQTVMAKLPDFQARDQDVVQLTACAKQTEDRVGALEAQMMQLTAQQSKLEQKVDETGRSQDAQICQFQHQMTAQMEAQGGQIETLFRQQMASIEHLLSQRPRSRSRHE